MRPGPNAAVDAGHCPARACGGEAALGGLFLTLRIISPHGYQKTVTPEIAKVGIRASGWRVRFWARACHLLPAAAIASICYRRAVYRRPAPRVSAMRASGAGWSGRSVAAARRCRRSGHAGNCLLNEAPDASGRSRESSGAVWGSLAFKIREQGKPRTVGSEQGGGGAVNRPLTTVGRSDRKVLRWRPR